MIRVNFETYKRSLWLEVRNLVGYINRDGRTIRYTPDGALRRELILSFATQGPRRAYLQGVLRRIRLPSCLGFEDVDNPATLKTRFCGPQD